MSLGCHLAVRWSIDWSSAAIGLLWAFSPATARGCRAAFRLANRNWSCHGFRSWPGKRPRMFRVSNYLHVDRAANTPVICILSQTSKGKDRRRNPESVCGAVRPSAALLSRYPEDDKTATQDPEPIGLTADSPLRDRVPRVPKLAFPAGARWLTRTHLARGNRHSSTRPQMMWAAVMWSC